MFGAEGRKTVIANRVSDSRAPSAPGPLVSGAHITAVFMGDRQKRAGKPETCSLGVSGVVAEIAGDLLPRHIEGLRHKS